MKTPQYRIVTPQQFSDGYLLFINGAIVRKRYDAVQQRPDGNYVVIEPQAPEERPEDVGRFPIIDAR